ncbi:MAG: NADAR family protein [Planctomycetota bacterium]|nr:NADAR family protein [Planctomycetota bacterium]
MPFLSRPDDIAFRQTTGDYGWLGNFSAHPVVYRNRRWRTTEALFQSLRFHPVHESAFIRDLWLDPNPKTCARLSRVRFEELRIHQPRHLMVAERLNDQDIANMGLVVRLKVAQHPGLREALLGTAERKIIEDVTGRPARNRTWGAALQKDGIWEGQNLLGQTWMDLRAQLCRALDLAGFGIPENGGCIFEPQELPTDVEYIRDEDGYLGQFGRLSPGQIIHAGLRWPSGEHLFQALRFAPGQVAIREEIRRQRTVRQAVNRARQLRAAHPGAGAHAPHTDAGLEVETGVFPDLFMGKTSQAYGLLGEQDLLAMRLVLSLKAAQLPGLRLLLVNSEDRVLVYNQSGIAEFMKDRRSIRFWGMAPEQAGETTRWLGLNRLGKLLGEVRTSARDVPDSLNAFGRNAQSASG